MPVDLSPYLIAPNEKPASATKQNNMLKAIQTALNVFAPSQIQGYPADSTKYLDGSGSWSSPVLAVTGPTVLTKTSLKDVVNTTTKTDLLNGEITVPGGSLSATGAIKFWFSGDYLNNSGTAQQITLELKLGSTVLWDSGTSDAILNGGSIRKAWWCEGMIQTKGSATSQQGGGWFALGPAGVAASVGTGMVFDVALTYGPLTAAFETVTASVAMGSAQALTFSVTHFAAAATVSMRLDYGRVEVF